MTCVFQSWRHNEQDKRRCHNARYERLKTFTNANLSGANSIFRVGDVNSTSASVVNEAKLATNSTIIATTLGIGDNTGEGGGFIRREVSSSLGTRRHHYRLRTRSIWEKRTEIVEVDSFNSYHRR